ncbi:MAG TPA: 1-deoxy-D-xylulose-5-phosphate reductoisomerase [Acidobacteriota bacterium]|nr:1-deoxy-D-xylulose-5-phosphate reductoisomerase [Acidobacteriota bacterium]
MKAISLLGSTGSIGANTLRVVAGFPRVFRVVGLSGGKNTAALADQVETVYPEIVSSRNEHTDAELQGILRQRGYPMSRTRFVSGVEGNIEVSCHPETQLVLSAITGAAGLLPTYRALENGKCIALANKETLVMAGEIMMQKAREREAEILPVDSEHNAIHQCLRGGRRNEVRRLILTASGGPFRETPSDRFHAITREEALNHPTWRMGKKITIDSATLMNKGLEVIEASWLFGVPPDVIDVAIHPQSIVHSMVEFVDGSLLAQLGPTDMRIPIQYALTYPERWNCPLPSLDVHRLSKLEFFEPDREKFKCLGLAYRALRTGGTAPAVLNAANEVVVESFLNDGIGFHEIPGIIEAVLDAHPPGKASSLEAVLKADAWAREETARLCHSRAQV